MTLVQASIAENGRAIILLSDRLLSRQISSDMPSYEFESLEPKIFCRDRIGIGFAGSSLYADIIERTVIENNLEDFDKIVKKISETLEEKRKEKIDNEVRRTTGVDPSEFFTKVNP